MPERSKGGDLRSLKLCLRGFEPHSAHIEIMITVDADGGCIQIHLLWNNFDDVRES